MYDNMLPIINHLINVVKRIKPMDINTFLEAAVYFCLSGIIPIFLCIVD